MLVICVSVCSGGCGTDGGYCVATDLCLCPHGFSGTNCEISTPGRYCAPNLKVRSCVEI